MQLDPYRPQKQHPGTIERIIRDSWKGETGVTGRTTQGFHSHITGDNPSPFFRRVVAIVATRKCVQRTLFPPFTRIIFHMLVLSGRPYCTSWNIVKSVKYHCGGILNFFFFWAKIRWNGYLIKKRKRLFDGTIIQGWYFFIEFLISDTNIFFFFSATYSNGNSYLTYCLQCLIEFVIKLFTFISKKYRREWNINKKSL